MSSSLNLKFAIASFKKSDRARRQFYEDFSQALKEGVSPDTRLKKLIARMRRRKGNKSILYEHWLRRIPRSSSFTKVFYGSIPDYELMVLSAAERDGRLDEAMDYLAKTLAITAKIKGAYFMAMFSPALSFVVIIGMLLMNALMIGPMNLQILPLSKWPDPSRNIYALSTALVNYWPIFVISFVLFWKFISYTKGAWYGKYRGYVDKLTFLPWGSYRIMQADNFLMALALMLQSSSVGMKEALIGMRDFSTPWMQFHLDRMVRKYLLKPDEPARALDTGLFPTEIMYRIEDLSERTDFQASMKKISIENGEANIEKANLRALMISFISLGMSAAFMMFYSYAQIEFGQAIQNGIGR